MAAEPVVPFSLTEPIRTRRLVLRLETPDDVDDVFAYQSREDVCRYLLYEPRTRDEVLDQLARNGAARSLEKNGDYLQLALELPAREGSGARVIGDLYFTIADLANSKAEIGWTLHPDFVGNGYAVEAATAVLDLAFRQMRLHRVVAELDPRNDGSIRLCIRLGMREEAFFAGDLWFKGDWADTGLYAVLRDEWLNTH
jgi:RimJ/RimL family protein N-acetyltransferase